MEYLNSRRCELKLEDQSAKAPNDVRTFNLRLLDETLTLQRHLLVSADSKAASGEVMQNMASASIESSPNSKKNVLGDMATEQHSSEFYQVFLSNKLGEKIQVAMLAKNKQCTDEELPPHLG